MILEALPKSALLNLIRAKTAAKAAVFLFKSLQNVSNSGINYRLGGILMEFRKAKRDDIPELINIRKAYLLHEFKSLTEEGFFRAKGQAC